MPALPKRKISTRRQGKRRAAKKIKLVNLIKCPACGKNKRSHQACPACGK